MATTTTANQYTDVNLRSKASGHGRSGFSPQKRSSPLAELYVPCLRCEGRGVVLGNPTDEVGGQVAETCDNCSGSGKVRYVRE